jgi:neutral ceramidase
MNAVTTSLVLSAGGGLKGAGLRLSIVAFVMAVSATWLVTADSQSAPLEAGVARVDLTPPEELNAALGGYGERMSKPAEGVLDRVFAKALVVSDGSRRFALVTADVLGFPPAFKPALVGRLLESGWMADQVMLLPSHSHSSIDMNAINPANVFGVPQIGVHDPKLYELVLDRMTQVVEEAESELVPVAVGTSACRLDEWTRNRRRDDGATDPELTVTRIDTLRGEPLAVLFNFTAHPTFMTADQMLFSGGWPGHAQRTLEALVGQGVTAMFYNGAQGDQRPAARPGSGSGRWEMAERYGRELGIETWKLWQTIPAQRDVAFDYRRQSIALPDYAWHASFMQTGGEEYGLSEELLKLALPLLFPRQTASVSLRLGELVVVGVPGEMAADLGLEIKTEAARLTGAEHPTVGGLADAWVSYILSEEAYREGGYEASVSFYGPALGRTIVTGVLEGTKRLNPSAETASK